MAELIEMPKLSDTMTEGTLVKWLVKEGDAIEIGDEIAEIETDKATMPVEAFDAGVVLKIVAQEGATAPVKSVIAVVGEEGEKVDEKIISDAQASKTVKSVAQDEPATPTKNQEVETPVASEALVVPTHSKSSFDTRVKASPLARKIAEEQGIALEKVSGSGPRGRIVKNDVLNMAQLNGGGTNWGVFPSGPIAKDENIPLTNMRKTIAKRLVESKQQSPHFYVEMEVDCDAMVVLRKQLNARFEKLAEPFKLSFNDFVMKAAANAAHQSPAINASWAGDTIKQHGSVHLAFGVAIDSGLITPVIKDAQSKSLKEISQEAKVLIVKAKQGKLTPEEYTTGTITISNLGMFGVDRFSAIVNPPQAAILAVGNIVKKPVLDSQDQIVVGHRMSITVSADHRVVDGAVAAIYLAELKALLETPSLLLL
ncbi:MAG: dihydrolipoamide acetyltransferase family protein [Verrucomicrobiota bacterium]